MKITIDKNTGIINIKQTVNGITYKKGYYLYTEKQAVERFKNYIEKQTK